MTEDQQLTLEALGELTRPNGEMCVGFRPLSDLLGQGEKRVRVIVRQLARRGWAEYYKGLWREDGEGPAGAGYCVTDEGLALCRVRLIKGGYFYRPDWCGYTNVRAEAGLYDRAEAERHVAEVEGVTIA